MPTQTAAPTSPAREPGALRAQLDALSSAEDLFAFFEVAYDERVLQVARLHILKRLNQYLSDAELASLADDELFDAFRARLERAYADFVASSPREQHVFAALERRAQANRAFVGLDELRPPNA